MTTSYLLHKIRSKINYQGWFSLICAYDIQTEPFLQILHNGQCRWVLICTVEAESNDIYVYDSKSPHVTHELKNQIASLLHTRRKEIVLKYCDVQRSKVQMTVICFV